MTAPDTDWPGLAGSPAAHRRYCFISLRDVSGGGKPVITVSTEKEVEGGGATVCGSSSAMGISLQVIQTRSMEEEEEEQETEEIPIPLPNERKLFMATLFHAHDSSEFMRDQIY